MDNRSGYAALVGRPNVGKSSLINRFLGQKLNIVSHKAQTTRHSIWGINTLDEGQIVYIDTPGIHDRGGKAMNRYLNRTARSALLDVDVVVFIVHALKWTDEDEKVLTALEKTTCKVIAAINKVDLVSPPSRLLPYIEELSERYNFHAVIPVSAQTGESTDILEKEILQCLPTGENIFPEDQLTTRSSRFFASELVREQIIRLYHEELPYAVTVEIEKFEETPTLLSIGAVIWVERNSQKGIIVGKKGLALKEAGTAARISMEAFYETKVYLKLWVKVKSSWANDEESLNQLGYSSD